MKKRKYNKSKTYLLPLLSEFISFDRKFFKYLINTYIFDSENKYKDCIFIEHEFNFKNPEFTKYEHKFIDNQYFIDLIDINSNKVIYIFKFPDDYIVEYETFKEGLYSLYSDDAKELILNFFNYIYSNNPNAVNFLMKVKQVFDKDKLLRKKLIKELSVKGGPKIILPKNAELTDKMDKESETLNLNKINENKISKIK